jgi:RND superfamily putative drug exporter
MKPVGDWNWYLPRWLEWLPRLGRHDPPTPTPTQEPRIPARV